MPMLKNRLTIVFVIIAQLIMLGHSAVAHDHTLGKPHHHSHSTDADHEHDSDNPLSDAFSAIAHQGDHATFTNPDVITIKSVKEQVKVKPAIVIEYLLPSQVAISYQKNTYPPDNSSLYILYRYSSQSLRGPPSLIV